MQQSLVSVIIPVYNTAAYLRECLDSVVNQTHGNNEVIVVDDGSTDDSLSIIDEFRNRFPTCKVIRTQNNGLASARNEGLRIASGAFILFLDSDDALVPHAIQQCLQAAQDFAADIVLYDAIAFADGVPSRDLSAFRYQRPEHLCGVAVSCETFFTESVRDRSYVVSACMYMYRREVFGQQRFLAGIAHEDNLFTTQLLIHHPRATAVCLLDRLYRRRVRPGSLMTEARTQRHYAGYITTVERLLDDPVAKGRDSLSHALHQFVQDILAAASLTALRAAAGRFPIALRLHALRIVLRSSAVAFMPKRALLCVFPELFALRARLGLSGSRQ